MLPEDEGGRLAKDVWVSFQKRLDFLGETCGNASIDELGPAWINPPAFPDLEGTGPGNIPEAIPLEPPEGVFRMVVSPRRSKFRKECFQRLHRLGKLE